MGVLLSANRTGPPSDGEPLTGCAGCDRDALLSAVAAQGYRELAEHLAAAHPAPRTPEDLAAVAAAYVRFAVGRPALFRVMFAEPCDPADAERVAAAAAMWDYVGAIVRDTFPGTDREAMSTAVWALVHGLAFLHLDGKLDPTDPTATDDRVRTAVRTLLDTTRPHPAAEPNR
ncbi:TetR-like C-terminal domain-containing protein [Kitasatospora sp. NPDC048296]|uniref:TetR-like C-terminal domain-containing protein n=1 Tax=Kitasatospora sp. NPDC048296 TaxID=3364048 RepID=UPI00371E8424